MDNRGRNELDCFKYMPNTSIDKLRSLLNRVLRHLLPDNADTRRGVMIFVCIAVFTWIGVDVIQSRVQDSLFAASHLFWALAFAGPIVALLLVVGTLVTALRRKWPPFSVFMRCALALTAGMVSPLLVSFLNWKLDSAPPQPVELVVTEKFTIVFGNNGYYHAAGEDQFVAFDTPPGLENWRIVYVFWPRIDQQPSLEQFTVGQRFCIQAHPGKFGCPWFDFSGQGLLHRLLSATPPPYTPLSEIRMGRTTVGGEYDRHNILSARGCFQLDSETRKQLEQWHIPIVIECPCKD